MDSSFNPENLEHELYEQWEQAGYFAPTGNGAKFSMSIPPPNVTGTLHMGHGFQHTLMDALVRYRRMCGDRALWQMGTDHAGIATQMLVERKLSAQGKSRHEVGREQFIKHVWEWKNESGGTITKQMRQMGSSLDWQRERFTMDPDYAAAVLEAFVRLHEDGLIYRGQRLVNWDPVLGTAISDLEVENVEEQGHMWHFRYPLANPANKTNAGDNFLVVATTRPETMLGDSAVAVHPDDERYQNLIGQTVLLPLVDREIPIIADRYVDPEFGTGCVKITPAHDFNDNEVGARHDLPLINIFTATAAISDKAPEAYRGLDRLDARKAIVADLDALSLLDKVDDHQLKVPRGDRSGAVVEPWLTNQWFVKIQPLAEPAIKAVENQDIVFTPKLYENTYFAWMRDIQDWCISRQLWWGHRIPAYYDDNGNIYVGRSEAEVRSNNNLDHDTNLRQDEDVLDTWFSSSLWTFATLGWPEETTDLETYHPTDTLITGHDIIFFWVARMIMMTLHLTGEVPFKTVNVTGLVRDGDGQKMSKTKGNGLDPLDFVNGVGLDELVKKRTDSLTQPKMAKQIEKKTRKEFPQGIQAYGTDALRFTFCALATTGRDVRFDINRVEGNRFFCNKLWNAARFVLSNCEDLELDAPAELTLADEWILTKSSELMENCERAFDTFRFDLYAGHLYEFIWHEYCDWYLEITKPLLWDEQAKPEVTNGIKRTLLSVLDALLRAAHPAMPYITESIWRDVAPRLNNPAPTIMVQEYPKATDFPTNPEAVAAIDWLKQVVTGIRTIRGEAGIKPKQTIKLVLQAGNARDRELATTTAGILQRMAKVEEITWLDSDQEPPPNALALVGKLKVMIPLAGLIDVGAESERIQKEIQRTTGEVDRISKKLGNAKFVANAPADVVAKEKDKLDGTQTKLATLQNQLKGLDNL